MRADRPRVNGTCNQRWWETLTTKWHLPIPTLGRVALDRLLSEQLVAGVALVLGGPKARSAPVGGLCLHPGIRRNRWGSTD